MKLTKETMAMVEPPQDPLYYRPDDAELRKPLDWNNFRSLNRI